MEADKDGDGRLSFEEFANMVSNTVGLSTFIFPFFKPSLVIVKVVVLKSLRLLILRAFYESLFSNIQVTNKTSSFLHFYRIS